MPGVTWRVTSFDCAGHTPERGADRSRRAAGTAPRTVTAVPAARMAPERYQRHAAVGRETLARSAIALYTWNIVDPFRLKFLFR